jgi:hypothetical protein
MMMMMMMMVSKVPRAPPSKQVYCSPAQRSYPSIYRPTRSNCSVKYEDVTEFNQALTFSQALRQDPVALEQHVVSANELDKSLN